MLAYRDALARLFILDPVDGWAPTNNHLKRLTQSPKHHLADPALAAALLGVTEDTLLRAKAACARSRATAPSSGRLGHRRRGGYAAR